MSRDSRVDHWVENEEVLFNKMISDNKKRYLKTRRLVVSKIL